jgi:hypothetical protein
MWVPNNPIERLWCWKRTGEGLLSTSFEINDYQWESTLGAQKQLASYDEVRVMRTSLLWIYKRFLRWTFKPFKLQSQELGRDN